MCCWFVAVDASPAVRSELIGEDAVAGGRSAPARQRAHIRLVAGAVLGALGLALLLWSVYIAELGSDPFASPTAALAQQVRERDRQLTPGEVGRGDPEPQARSGLGAVPSEKGSGSREPQPTGRQERPVAPPVSMTIPALGLHRDLVDLEVIDGTLQVPQRWRDVGWWQDGPNPGATGSAVFIGHVDSDTGPAVFYGLSSLRKDEVIKVLRLDKTTATFQVDRKRLVARGDFPSARIYRQDGPPTLHLITCGGAYDDDAGHYSDNLIVTAHLMKKEADDSR